MPCIHDTPSRPPTPHQRRGHPMCHVRFACLAVPLAACAGRLAAQGLTPDEALKRMKVPDGLEVKLVASEPDVRQPVSMTFDDQGRMWVIQYLQYPAPAGL